MLTAQNLHIGQLISWQHPFSNQAFHGSVKKIGPHFIRIKDAAGWEDIPESWITWRRPVR